MCALLVSFRYSFSLFVPFCLTVCLSSLSLPHCISLLFSLCPSLVLNLYLSLSVFACHCLSVCLTFCLVICPSFCIFIFYLNFMFSFRILSVNFVLHAILFHFISYFLQNLIFKSCLMSLPINLNFPELDVSVTIGNPVFCLASYLTGVHFRGKLQHVGDVSEQKFKCRPIRTRELGGVKLSEEMYVKIIRPCSRNKKCLLFC